MMEVVCVLWSTHNLAIQEEEAREVRIRLEHQAAKTSLMLFKVLFYIKNNGFCIPHL
jgi:hypothetical protein